MDNRKFKKVVINGVVYAVIGVTSGGLILGKQEEPHVHPQEQPTRTMTRTSDAAITTASTNFTIRSLG